MSLVSTRTSSSGGGGVTVLNYTEFTASVTVTAVAEASATTVVTASAAITSDGTTVYCVEFFAPAVVAGAGAGATVLIDLFMDGTSLGRLLAFSSSAGSENSPVGILRRYLTPAAGARTFSVRAWRTVADGAITAGAGGATSYLPGYIRVTSGS